MSWKVKLIFVLAVSALLGGCMWYDVGLCKSVGSDYCDRRFKCTPAYAASTWGSREDCYLVMDGLCEAADAEPTCDFEDAELRSCQDAINNTSCLTMPAEYIDGWNSCTYIYSCY